MMREINLLARRPVKVFNVFEILDVVLFIMFVCVAPLAMYVGMHIPFYWSLLVSSTPMLVFIFKFRIRRRDGYFQHWIDYKMRPRFWIFGFAQKNRWDDFKNRCLGYKFVARRDPTQEP